MTINSPDDIGGTLPGGPRGTASPVEGDIDWLRSTTTTRVDRTALQPKTKHVDHRAYFGIRPETVEDVLADHSATVAFRPEFLTAEWDDGALTRVSLSGPQRLKSGGVSDKQSRHHTWRSWGLGRSTPVDKAKLPAPVADALTAYETAIAVEASGGRK